MHVLHGSPLPPEAAGVVGAVSAALSSYDVENVRDLFDACLLARATSEELEEAFHVTPGEYAAYAHLFFDRSVFSNDFHVQAYIALQDGPRREILKEGFVRGFSTLRVKYAGAQALSPEAVVSQMLTRDAQLYAAAQDIPLGDKRTKAARDLGKQLLATVVTATKVASPKDEAVSAGEAEFVIQSGPKNPTLEDLASRGIEVVR